MERNGKQKNKNDASELAKGTEENQAKSYSTSIAKSQRRRHRPCWNKFLQTRKKKRNAKKGINNVECDKSYKCEPRSGVGANSTKKETNNSLLSVIKVARASESVQSACTRVNYYWCAGTPSTVVPRIRNNFPRSLASTLSACVSI